MSDDDLITRYNQGETCPECGKADLEESEEDDDGETYLECLKCGAISNRAVRGTGHTFI